MKVFAHDIAASRFASGLLLAVVSALSFGLSGSLAKSLLVEGWSAGAITLLRVAIGALALTAPGILALRGRWDVLRRGAGAIVAYGLLAVAGAQLFYFLAVSSLDVGVALLIEYMAPLGVVAWLWARHGRRPGRLTVVGAAVAICGLVLLLNVIGGGQISIAGVLWALGATVGATVYFIISGDDSTGLPGITLAAGGLAVAVVALGAAALLGVLPLAASTAPASLGGATLPWWAVIALLGTVTAGLAYVAGIAATRRLGARLGSFVALSEVLAATAFAWALLGQALLPVQIGGAVLVLAGVVLVKLGEPKPGAPELSLDVVPAVDGAGVEPLEPDARQIAAG